MNAILLSALLRKKAELLADIERLESEAETARQQIVHIDGTLLAFGYQSDKQARPFYKAPPGLFGRGELARILCERLRVAGPQTTVQLRDYVIALKDLNPDDLRLKKLMYLKILKTIKRQQERGTVVRDGEAWRVA